MQDTVCTGQISGHVIQIKSVSANSSNVRNSCSLRIFNNFCYCAGTFGFGAAWFCGKFVDYPVVILGFDQAGWFIYIVRN